MLAGSLVKLELLALQVKANHRLGDPVHVDRGFN